MSKCYAAETTSRFVATLHRNIALVKAVSTFYHPRRNLQGHEITTRHCAEKESLKRYSVRPTSDAGRQCDKCVRGVSAATVALRYINIAIHH